MVLTYIAAVVEAREAKIKNARTWEDLEDKAMIRKGEEGGSLYRESHLIEGMGIRTGLFR